LTSVTVAVFCFLQ